MGQNLRTPTAHAYAYKVNSTEMNEVTSGEIKFLHKHQPIDRMHLAEHSCAH